MVSDIAGNFMGESAMKDIMTLGMGILIGVILRMGIGIIIGAGSMVIFCN